MSRGSHSNIVELSMIVNETADCTEARYPRLSWLTSNDEATRTRAGSVSDRRVSALGRRPDDPVGSWMGAGSSRLRERLVTPPSVNLWIVRLQSSDVLPERHRSQLDTLPTRTVTCNKDINRSPLTHGLTLQVHFLEAWGVARHPWISFYGPVACEEVMYSRIVLGSNSYFPTTTIRVPRYGGVSEKLPLNVISHSLPLFHASSTPLHRTTCDL